MPEEAMKLSDETAITLAAAKSAIRRVSEFEKSPKFSPTMFAIDDWMFNTEHYDWLYYLFKTIVNRIGILAPHSDKYNNKRNIIKRYMWDLVKQLMTEDGDQFLTVS